MKPAIGALLVMLVMGCGTDTEHVSGLECTLNLRIHTPPYQDAFDGVSTLRMTLELADGRELITNVDISATELFLEGSPAQGVVMVLEGVGVDGQTVISSGRSIPFDLSPTEPAEVNLLFARKGEFARLLGDLGHARFGHTASVLPDGRVLIFGGAAQGDLDAPAAFPPPEIFSLVSQKSCVFEEELCPLYPGADRRFGHSATAMADGEVLIFGGEDESLELVEAVLQFDSGTDEFSELTNFNPQQVVPRAYHAAVRFQFDDGTGHGFREAVLLAGGEVDGGARRMLTANGLLFDVQAKTFTRTDLALNHPRRKHTLTAFGADNSRVLAAGGEGASGLVNAGELSDGESFWVVQPAGSDARDGLLNPRVNHSAVAVSGGVLILGGDDLLASIDEPEIFLVGSPMGAGFFTMQVQAVHQEHSARRGLVAAQLPSGVILYAGGESLSAFDRELLGTAETLQTEEGTLDAAFSAAAPIGQKLSFPAVTALPGGALLITGGLRPDAGGLVPSAGVWYYNP
jgi:hypothetical protein